MTITLITYVTLAFLLLFSFVNGREKVGVDKDLLEEMSIPAHAYLAGQAARALEDFRFFQAFVAALESEIQLSSDGEKSLYSINMGATAISTGINVPKHYPQECAALRARLTGNLSPRPPIRWRRRWTSKGLVVSSSALKSLAAKPPTIASEQSPPWRLQPER